MILYVCGMWDPLCGHYEEFYLMEHNAMAQPPVPSLHSLSFDPLPSVPTPKDDIYVLSSTRPHSKTLVSSTATIPMHANGPSTSCLMSAVQLSPAAANIFVVEETSSPLSSVNINVSDRELMYIYCQSSSLKPAARHSLLKKKLNLASLSELTSRKGKLYEHIQNKKSSV